MYKFIDKEDIKAMHFWINIDLSRANREWALLQLCTFMYSLMWIIVVRW